MVKGSSAGRHHEVRHRGLHRCRVVWVLGMLLRLVGTHHCFLCHLRLHAVDWGGHRRVVWAQLVVRNWRARVDSSGIRWRRQLFMLQGHGGLDAQEFWAGIFESAVWRNCKRKKKRENIKSICSILGNSWQRHSAIKTEIWYHGSISF